MGMKSIIMIGMVALTIGCSDNTTGNPLANTEWIANNDSTREYLVFEGHNFYRYSTDSSKTCFRLRYQDFNCRVSGGQYLILAIGTFGIVFIQDSLFIIDEFNNAFGYKSAVLPGTFLTDSLCGASTIPVGRKEYHPAHY